MSELIGKGDKILNAKVTAKTGLAECVPLFHPQHFAGRRKLMTLHCCGMVGLCL